MITKTLFREAPLQLVPIRLMHHYQLTWLTHTKYGLV